MSSLARRALAGTVLVLGLVFLPAFAEDIETKIEVGHVKVGQQYKFKLTANNTRLWEVVAKTDDEITYRIRQTVAGKELPAGEPTKCPIKRKEKKEDAARKKKVAEEALTVSGVKFPCVVYETETGGMTVKTWVSTLFPELIKQQMGKDVTQELVEIK
jgi:hypothetical protein